MSGPELVKVPSSSGPLPAYRAETTSLLGYRRPLAEPAAPAPALAASHPLRQAERSAPCPVSPRACPFGGACHTCPVNVQAKLTISQPGDKYEQEADRVANQVMRMPELCSNCGPRDKEAEIQTKPLTELITPLVQRQAEPEKEKEEEEEAQSKPLEEGIGMAAKRQAVSEDDEEEVQTRPAEGGITPVVQGQAKPEEEEKEVEVRTKPITHQQAGVQPTLTTRIQSQRGQGQPLPASDRAFFEPRFGYDFGKVRIHRDALAATLAKSLTARAFTIGNDIFFGNERNSSTTSGNESLLAHELTHVIQQRGKSDRINCSAADKRKTIVSTAEALSEEHYLMGAAGQIPDQGGGLGSRSVKLDPGSRSASILLGKILYTCCGRCARSKFEHMRSCNPSGKKSFQVAGESCEGKRHFDCGGFVSYCYNKACPEVKYPGPAGNLLTEKFGWIPVLGMEKLQPGDITFRKTRSEHVGIYVGNGEVLSSLKAIDGVKKDKVTKYQKFGYLGCLDEKDASEDVIQKKEATQVSDSPEQVMTSKKRKRTKKVEARLSFDQVKSLVESNNHCALSTNLLICLIWKESTFSPKVKNLGSSATGLMQMTRGAVEEVNRNSPKGIHFEHSEMTDSARNIQCGTRYLALRIKWAKRNVTKGLEGYGTGSGYAAGIQACETCLAGGKTGTQGCLEQVR